MHIYAHNLIYVFRWNAACMIQRNFIAMLRQKMENNTNNLGDNLLIYNSNSSYMQRGKMMMKTLRKNMQNSMKKSIYLDRLEACAIIIDFLLQIKKQSFKSALRLYVR